MFVTKRQKEVLDYLKGYLAEHGYSPTFDEIGHAFGFSSKGTVYKHIKALQEKRLIRHEWNRTRAIEIERPEKEESSLPILGLVAAGRPIEAIESHENVKVPSEFLRTGRHYVLRVVGNSMIEEQIADGDFVVVQERVEAHNGETVVALIDGGEVTIKKFFKRNGEIELRPANENLDSMVVAGDRVRVQGIVVGVLRKY
ncbi:MAG: transcriptional repressor LexA [Candidatus Neomarinimicrobiota bacterium]